MTQDSLIPTAETAILEAMSRLLAHASLDDITVAQVLVEAEISRATFYFYFAGIDQVFVALLSEVLETAVSGFRAVLADQKLRRSRDLGPAVAQWLSLTGHEREVIRNAVAEWPRRPDVAEIYLAAMGSLTDSLAAAIDEDRKARFAVASIPSDQLAAGWVWTVEQSWYHVVGMEGSSSVIDGLAGLLVSAVYGR